MTEELRQVYNTATEKPLRVLDIFNEFFGEDKVDLQGLPSYETIESGYNNLRNSHYDKRAYIESMCSNMFILVHFPRVKVTNEFDRYTFVNHLYAKVSIDSYGRLRSKFSLNRSEYTVQHFTCNYMHSHISNIPINNFEQFQIPCTGSGPINNTICSLIHEYDEDLWKLFCLELDKFVQVESISGTPYHRLESLSTMRSSSYVMDSSIYFTNKIDCYTLGGGYQTPCKINMAQLGLFTKFVIDQNALKFTYNGGKYQVAMSPVDFQITMSNLFIKWYNREFNKGNLTTSYGELIGSHILESCKFISGKIWRSSGNTGSLRNYTAYIGSKICTFKGRDILLTIPDSTVTEGPDNTLLILNTKISNYIITKILNVINFKYGNNDNQENPNDEGVYFL